MAFTPNALVWCIWALQPKIGEIDPWTSGLKWLHHEHCTVLGLWFDPNSDNGTPYNGHQISEGESSRSSLPSISNSHRPFISGSTNSPKSFND